MTGRHVFFEGRVQGVGFRWTVKNLARGYEVTGWVKNLTDGRVEMQTNGESEEVEAFIEAITESELKSHIKKTEVSVVATPVGFHGFEICQ